MGPLRRNSIAVRTAGPVAVSAGIAAALFACSALAAEDAPPDSASPRYRLDPTVITADRLPLPLARVPSDVTVIGAARLALAQAFFIADELREVPGLDVQRFGSLGKLTDVRLRGADPRHTLVLFDGIPLNGPWLGSFDFADVSGTGWGQVEVMGGPASSLYGSGAVGGVIHLLSRSGARGAAGGPVRAFAEFGENATLRQGAEWRGTVGAGEAGALASRLTSDGVGPRDAYSGANGRLHAEVPAAGGVARLTGLLTRGKKEIPYDYRFAYDAILDAFVASQVIDPNTDQTDRLGVGGVSYSRSLGRRITLEVEAAGLTGRIDYENGPDTTPDYLETKLTNTRDLFSIRARLHDPGAVQAAFGAEYRGDQVDRTERSEFSGFPTDTRVEEGTHVRALYVQAHLEPGSRLLLDAGVRVDDHSRYGAYGVPRVAIGLRAKELGLKLRGGFGRAFTAPTLSDLFYPGFGNENLRPERSRTWEAGADGEWMDGRIAARATWHTTRFVDLIQSASFNPPDNIGSARIEGEEYWVRVAPARGIALSARAAHLVAKRLDAPTGGDNRLPKRPAWRAGVAAEATSTRGFAAIASLRWVDSMTDPFDFYDVGGRYLDGDNPGYASLDLGGVIPLRRWAPAELRVKLTNALDRAHSEVKGYPARGRAFTAGVTFGR